MTSDLLIRAVGVISVLLSLFAIWFILFMSELDVSKPISFHVAIARRNHYIFGVLMSIALIEMGFFIYLWLIPHYHLPGVFSIIAGIAIILEIITTWIPLTTGWRKLVHNICSYGTALLLPVLLLLVLMSPEIGIVLFYICLTSTALMLIFLFLFFLVKSTHTRYLLFQTSYIFLFNISILSLALIK